MPKSLDIVSVAAELAPFSKTGGLGEIARTLPRAIAARGHTIASITPLHRTAKEKAGPLTPLGEADIRLGAGAYKKASFFEGTENGVRVFFIDHPPFFSEHERIYTSDFENERFYFFNLAVLALIKRLKRAPDIIQCHDWHTALIPWMLHQSRHTFTNTASLFTIHNLAFQMGKDWWTVPPEKKDDGHRTPEQMYEKGEIEFINFALRGIRYADAISTVSEHYAQEILTKDFGERLDPELKKRKSDVFGIVNGVDYETFNPATDPGLAARYDADTIQHKADNKRTLQRLFGLSERNDVAVIGMVSRITEQKGFDLVLSILDSLMGLKVQLIIMGKGDPAFEQAFKNAARRHLDKFGFMPFRQKYETLVYAGSDFFLMPSRFEPCGLGQLLSLRYGSIPIVHAVGGLSETVKEFNPHLGHGNGFIFTKYDPQVLLGAIVRAVENWMKNGEAWQKLLRNSMKETFGWDIPARRYIALFRHAIRQHHKERSI